MRVLKRDIGKWCWVKYDNPPNPQKGIIVHTEGRWVEVLFPPNSGIDTVEHADVVEIGRMVK